MLLKEYIDNCIGLGKYQITTFIVLCFVAITEGVELSLNSFLNLVIKNQKSMFN
jgi:hypothetical protein